MATTKPPKIARSDSTRSLRRSATRHCTQCVPRTRLALRTQTKLSERSVCEPGGGILESSRSCSWPRPSSRLGSRDMCTRAIVALISGNVTAERRSAFGSCKRERICQRRNGKRSRAWTWSRRPARRVRLHARWDGGGITAGMWPERLLCMRLGAPVGGSQLWDAHSSWSVYRLVTERAIERAHDEGLTRPCVLPFVPETPQG